MACFASEALKFRRSRALTTVPNYKFGGSLTNLR
jgi:hypothetical protein